MSISHFSKPFNDAEYPLSSSDNLVVDVMIRAWAGGDNTNLDKENSSLVPGQQTQNILEKSFFNHFHNPHFQVHR